MDTKFRKWRNRLIYFCARTRKSFHTYQKTVLVLFALSLLAIWMRSGSGSRKSAGPVTEIIELKFYKLDNLDLNKDKKVDLEEFLTFGRIRDVKLTSTADLLKVTDIDGDTLITFQEFLAGGLTGAFGRRCEKIYFEKIARAYFKKADRKKNGHLSIYEWRRVMDKLLDSLRSVYDEDMMQIFKAADLNRDNFLTILDFEDKRMMRIMDADFDQKVSLIEFISGRLKPIKLHDQATVVDVCDDLFQGADKNKDGRLVLGEFEELRKSEGIPAIQFISAN